MIFRLTRHPSLRWLLPCACLLLGACTTGTLNEVSVRIDSESLEGVSKAKPSSPDGLSNELVYAFLLGDAAARRDSAVTGARSMAKAARLSRDRQVILRAFSLSMRAKEGGLALEMAQLLQTLEPDTMQARTLIAQALISLDRPEEVFDSLLALVEAPQPGPAGAFQHIAEVLVRQQSPDHWLLVLERLLAKYADLPEAHLAVARVAHRAGDLPQALSRIESALELRPDFSGAAQAMLGLLREQNKLEQLRVFAENFLQQHPDRGVVRLLYARVLVQLEDSERAFYHFNQLVLREPSNPDGLYAAGLLSLNNSNYVTAENFLVRHLKLRPGHDQTRLFLARLERERGRFDAARGWLRQVTDPEHYFAAQLRITYVFAADARFDEAVAHLAEIVPDSVEDQVRIYLTHEELLRDAGRLEDAYAVLNAALADLPDDVELLYARGLITAHMDLLDVHERDMRRLIELKPDHAHAYNALGYTLADRTTRYEEARVLIEKALSLKPNDPFILDSMGWVHYRLGNRDQARDYLQQALDLRLDPEIAAHLGEVLWMMDRHEEARAVWKRGESIDIKNKTLRETLRKFVK